MLTVSDKSRSALILIVHCSTRNERVRSRVLFEIRVFIFDGEVADGDRESQCDGRIPGDWYWESIL